MNRVDLQHPHPPDGAQYMSLVRDSRRPLDTLRGKKERPGGRKGETQHARNILQGWSAHGPAPHALPVAKA
jgi:hypothetical protein